MIQMPDSFANLQNTFAPQQQMALQSAAGLKQITDQIRAQNAGYSGLGSLYNAMPDAPQLKFGVDVPSGSIAEGLTQGLGNTVNNFLQMRNYNQRSRMIQDLAGQQQAQQQQAYDLAQKQEQDRIAQEQNQYRVLSEQFPDLAQTFAYSDPTTRGKIWGDIATRNAGLAYKPLELTADKVGGVKAQFAAGDQANAEIEQRKIPLYNTNAQGVQTPLAPAQAAQAKLYGLPDSTVEDVTGRRLDLAGKVQNLNQNAPKVATAAQSNALDLAGKQLSNQQAALNVAQEKVNLKYADAEKQIEVLTGQNKLKEAQDVKAKLDAGMTRYNQALASYGAMNNGQIKLFNSQMKALSLPYELPEKPELKAGTEKGKVKEFYNPETGEVFKPKKAK